MLLQEVVQVQVEQVVLLQEVVQVQVEPLLEVVQVMVERPRLMRQERPLHLLISSGSKMHLRLQQVKQRRLLVS